QPEFYVRLEFSDIRTDEIIKKENHEIFKYEHNVITFDELRRNIGLDQLSEEQKQGLYLYQVTIPRVQAEAEARAGTRSGSDTGSPDTDNRNKPRNQHGVKAAPRSRLKVASQEDAEENLPEAKVWRQIITQAHRDIVQTVQSDKAKDLGFIGHLVQERLRQAVYPLIVENVLAGLDHFRLDLRLDRGSSHRPSVRISP